MLTSRRVNVLFLKKPNDTLFKRISRFGGGLHSAVHEKVTEFPAITLSSLVSDLRRVSTGLSVEKTQEYKYSPVSYTHLTLPTIYSV